MSVLSIYPSVVIAGVVNLLPLTAGVAFLENVPSFVYANGVIATRLADTVPAEYAFILTNETSVEMVEFYASPQTAVEWEADILANRTIRANGDWTTITLPGNRGCIYDFLAVCADGDKLERYGIDVCELETHTYYEN